MSSASYSRKKNEVDYSRLPATSGSIMSTRFGLLSPITTCSNATDETPELQTVKPVTLRSSLKSVRLNLWDEEQRKLVSFGSLKARRD